MVRVTSCIQNQSTVFCVPPEVSLISSLNAESCLREKQVTEAFTLAGHYTDLTAFNSVRHSANQSQLPACCSPECQQPGSFMSSGSWCSSGNPGCRGMTPSNREQHSRNQCLFQPWTVTLVWKVCLHLHNMLANSVWSLFQSCFNCRLTHISNNRITTHNNNAEAEKSLLLNMLASNTWVRNMIRVPEWRNFRFTNTCYCYQYHNKVVLVFTKRNIIIKQNTKSTIVPAQVRIYRFAVVEQRPYPLYIWASN